jgi:hypothetical protein
MSDLPVPGVVRLKDGVLFSVIAPAGFRILSAIDQTAEAMGRDLEITSACDGVHSGTPEEPHHSGEAYDVRTHDFPSEQFKQMVLEGIMQRLDPERFFGFLEDSGTDNEHIHCQRKKGTVYP